MQVINPYTSRGSTVNWLKVITELDTLTARVNSVRLQQVQPFPVLNMQDGVWSRLCRNTRSRERGPASKACKL